MCDTFQGTNSLFFSSSLQVKTTYILIEDRVLDKLSEKGDKKIAARSSTADIRGASMY